MKLGVIFARARNGVIGRDGQLPWHLPEDLAHFKQATLGSPVIMGRRTWESIPERFRPLPGRRNIVVTRQADWSAAGAQRAASLEEAIAQCADAACAWVIGGAALFAAALPRADVAEVTEIDADFDGDVFAPEFGPGWQEISRVHHNRTGGANFSFATYRNTHPGD